MAGYISNQGGLGLLAATLFTRRKIFVSYHHGKDQAYYDEFSRFFHDQFEAVFDNSLERRIDSDDVRYVIQRIRDKHITGTSCTVLLIGAESYLRKYVDWEIKATLDKGHGLLGIVLPTRIVNPNGQIIAPDRFIDNFNSGYAVLADWQGLNVERFTQLIEAAIGKPERLIQNSREMRQRNG